MRQLQRRPQAISAVLSDGEPVAICVGMEEEGWMRAHAQR